MKQHLILFYAVALASAFDSDSSTLHSRGDAGHSRSPSPPRYILSPGNSQSSIGPVPRGGQSLRTPSPGGLRLDNENRSPSPGQRNDSPGHWRPGRKARLDDARIHIDNHGTGSYIQTKPWHFYPPGQWGHATGTRDWNAARHVTGVTMQSQDHHKVSIKTVGHKIASRVDVGPGGSAILKGTGAGGTETRILGYGMQNSGTMHVEGDSNKPARLSIKGMGQGGTVVVATKAPDDKLPPV